MTPNAYENNWEPVKKGQFAFTFVFVEILISQESILNSFTESEAKTVLAELLKKNELKAHHPELYSMFDIQFNSYSMAKLLYSKGKGNGISQALLQTPAMDEFLKSGRLKNKEVLSVLFQKAKEFLNAN